MSAQKMREVVRQIQGLPAIEAMAIRAVIPRKSAREVAKTSQHQFPSGRRAIVIAIEMRPQFSVSAFNCRRPAAVSR